MLKRDLMHIKFRVTKYIHYAPVDIDRTDLFNIIDRLLIDETFAHFCVHW